MKTTFKLTFFVAMMLAAFTLVSCDNDDPKGSTGTLQSVTLQGTVSDIYGNPLSGVSVTTGSLSATTDSDGSFSFNQASINDNRAVIKFKKNGYFTVTRSGVKESEMNIEVAMQAKGSSNVSVQTTFDAAEGRILSVAGMEVDIPASSLVNADGTTYTGNVNADMFYLDPNNENFTELMPGGDLAAIRDNNTQVQLISYGMTEVSLTDNAGNPLQLRDGAKSEFTFPIPEGMENNPPAEIPLWYFDEDKGIWIEEGMATLQGNVYVGDVSHFSWHNLDVPAERVTIKGKVTDCEDKPVPYVKVTIEQTAAVTNSNGEYTAFVPANTLVTVMVKSKDYGNYLPEVSHDVGGRAGGTTVTQNISLPCRTQEQGPGDDSITDFEKGSVTYLMNGQTYIFTFDNYGRRLRLDSDYGTANHSVVIFDDIAGTYTMGGAEQWYEMPATGGVSGQQIVGAFIFQETNYPGYGTEGNETIAGKSCRVITADDDGCYVKVATWNGLVMLAEDCEGVAMIATDVSLDIPANAFTKTMDIFD